jgi:hypothetical protein
VLELHRDSQATLTGNLLRKTGKQHNRVRTLTISGTQGHLKVECCGELGGAEQKGCGAAECGLISLSSWASIMWL